MKKSAYLLICVLLVSIVCAAQSHKPKRMEKKNIYCEYCGHKFPDVRQLVAAPCGRHPDGANKGRHKLYEGQEKSVYTCKYCGRTFPSILVMTGAPCQYHPKGTNKGHHSPAL